MALPKYVRTIGGTNLYYDRGVPKKLWDFTTQRRIRIPLDVTASDSMRAIFEATGRASDSYDRQLRVIENSDAVIGSEEHLQEAVNTVLKKVGAKSGAAAGGKVKTAVPGKEELLERLTAEGVLTLNGKKLTVTDTDNLFSALAEVIGDARADALLEPVKDEHPAVLAGARQALKSQRRQERLKLSDLWLSYLAGRVKRYEESGKSPQQVARDSKKLADLGERFMAHIGDVYVDAPHAADQIHAGLDAYVDAELLRCKPSSVQRRLNDFIAAIKQGVRKKRLQLQITPPDVGKIVSAQKATMSAAQQVELLMKADCMEGALCLLLLQCGGMQSEVQAIDLDEGMRTLQMPVPYLMMGKKTEARKRATPVAIGTAHIVKHFPAMHEYVNSVTESAVSHRLATWLQSNIGPDLTAHCGRHTLKAQAVAKNANPLHVVMIAGWGYGGVKMSDKIVNYGASAIEDSDILQALTETSRQMFPHLVDAAQPNVTPIRRKAKAKSKAKKRGA